LKSKNCQFLTAPEMEVLTLPLFRVLATSDIRSKKCVANGANSILYFGQMAIELLTLLFTALF